MDLSASPPAPGTYHVTVTIPGGSATCSLNVPGSVGVIEGVVEDASSNALAGAIVNLYDNVPYQAGSASPISETTTGPDGSYQFADLAVRHYITAYN